MSRWACESMSMKLRCWVPCAETIGKGTPLPYIHLNLLMLLELGSDTYKILYTRCTPGPPWLPVVPGPARTSRARRCGRLTLLSLYIAVSSRDGTSCGFGLRLAPERCRKLPRNQGLTAAVTLAACTDTTEGPALWKFAANCPELRTSPTTARKRTFVSAMILTRPPR
jgi:hypothetical protein